MFNLFNPNRPVFVKTPFAGAGRQWKTGEKFHWEFTSVPHYTIQTLFNNDYLHHNPELEEGEMQKVKIGDGLEALSIEELEILVSNINAKVKAKTKNPSEFLQKRCPSSRIKDKQIGKIRSWRIAYGHLEND